MDATKVVFFVRMPELVNFLECFRVLESVLNCVGVQQFAGFLESFRVIDYSEVQKYERVLENV